MFDYHQPDARGHFGPYGGTFVAVTLIHALRDLEANYERYRHEHPEDFQWVSDHMDKWERN